MGLTLYSPERYADADMNSLHVSLRSALQFFMVSGIAMGTLGACSQAPEEGQCEDLLNHTIEIVVNDGHASAEHKATYTTELKAKTAEVFLKDCEKKLKASQIACSLKATTLDGIDKCDG